MSRSLVITGMHRSATSLVASAFMDAGLDIGVHLNGPGPGNPRGHFEDWDFHRFHEAALTAAGHTAFTADRDLSATLPPQLAAEARGLVARRAHLPLWGWKDPRSCLFLELWQELLPRGNYLFLYRHPADVALSLLRRDTEPETRHDPWLTVDAWRTHNRLLLELKERHSSRAFLAHAPTAARDLGALVRSVGKTFDLPLQTPDAARYQPSDLTPEPAQRPDWQRLWPDAIRIYRRLEAAADLPSAPPAGDRRAGHGALELEERLLYELLEGRLVWAAERDRAAVLGDRAAALGERATALTEDLAQARIRDARREQDLESARQEVTRLDQQRQELAASLQAIDSSRGYAVIRTWWRLRRRLARRPPP